ncbi:MAG: hypothetical protein ACYSXF_06985 [Planctomycetota bacterium]|jgi:hypothetical protein
MVRLMGANKKTGSNGQRAVSDNGALARARITGPNGAGTDPNAVTEGAATEIEESLSQIRERRLAELRLRGCE